MAERGNRRPSFKQVTEHLKARPAQPSVKPYKVSLTETAKGVYLEMADANRKALENGDSTNHHCKTFRMVDEAIRKLIPSDPTNPKYALHEPLADLYRIAKGRLRIVWIVEPNLREILIVYISDSLRKDGDKSDPYAILTAMAKAGYLSSIIDEWRSALDVGPDAPIN